MYPIFDDKVLFHSRRRPIPNKIVYYDVGYYTIDFGSNAVDGKRFLESNASWIQGTLT